MLHRDASASQTMLLKKLIPRPTDAIATSSAMTRA
jgi:hypothetical protein